MGFQHATGSDPGAFCEARSGIYVRELNVCVIFLVFKGNNLHSGFSPTVDPEVERKWKVRMMAIVQAAWNLAGPENRAGFVSYASKVACHRLGAMSITPSLTFGNAGADSAQKDVYMDYARHGMHIVGGAHAHFNRLAREMVYYNHNFNQFARLQGVPDPAEALTSLTYPNDDGNMVHCDPIPFHAVRDADLLAYWRGRYKWHYLNCQQYHVVVVKHRYKQTQAKLKDAITAAQSATITVKTRSGIPRWIPKTSTKGPAQLHPEGPLSTPVPEVDRCESPLTELEDSSADEADPPEFESSGQTSSAPDDMGQNKSNLVLSPPFDDDQVIPPDNNTLDTTLGNLVIATNEMSIALSSIPDVINDHGPSPSPIVTPSTAYHDNQTPASDYGLATSKVHNFNNAPDMSLSGSKVATNGMSIASSSITLVSGAVGGHAPSTSPIITPSIDNQSPDTSGSTNHVPITIFSGTINSQSPIITPSAAYPTSDLTIADVEMSSPGVNNPLPTQTFTPEGPTPDFSHTSNSGSKKRKLSDCDENGDDGDGKEMDQQNNSRLDECDESDDVQSGRHNSDVGSTAEERTGGVNGHETVVDVSGDDGEEWVDDEDGYGEDSEGDSEDEDEGDEEAYSDPVYDVEDVSDRRILVCFLLFYVHCSALTFVIV